MDAYRSKGGGPDEATLSQFNRRGRKRSIDKRQKTENHQEEPIQKSDKTFAPLTSREINGIAQEVHKSIMGQSMSIKEPSICVANKRKENHQEAPTPVKPYVQQDHFIKPAFPHRKGTILSRLRSKSRASAEDASKIGCITPVPATGKGSRRHKRDRSASAPTIDITAGSPVKQGEDANVAKTQLDDIDEHACLDVESRQRSISEPAKPSRSSIDIGHPLDCVRLLPPRRDSGYVGSNITDDACAPEPVSPSKRRTNSFKKLFRPGHARARSHSDGGFIAGEASRPKNFWIKHRRPRANSDGLLLAVTSSPQKAKASSKLRHPIAALKHGNSKKGKDTASSSNAVEDYTSLRPLTAFEKVEQKLIENAGSGRPRTAPEPEVSNDAIRGRESFENPFLDNHSSRTPAVTRSRGWSPRKPRIFARHGKVGTAPPALTLEPIEMSPAGSFGTALVELVRTQTRGSFKPKGILNVGRAVNYAASFVGLGSPLSSGDAEDHHASEGGNSRRSHESARQVRFAMDGAEGSLKKHLPETVDIEEEIAAVKKKDDSWLFKTGNVAARYIQNTTRGFFDAEKDHESDPERPVFYTPPQVPSAFDHFPQSHAVEELVASNIKDIKRTETLKAQNKPAPSFMMADIIANMTHKKLPHPAIVASDEQYIGYQDRATRNAKNWELVKLARRQISEEEAEPHEDTRFRQPASPEESEQEQDEEEEEEIVVAEAVPVPTPRIPNYAALGLHSRFIDSMSPGRDVYGTLDSDGYPVYHTPVSFHWEDDFRVPYSHGVPSLVTDLPPNGYPDVPVSVPVRTIIGFPSSDELEGDVNQHWNNVSTF